MTCRAFFSLGRVLYLRIFVTFSCIGSCKASAEFFPIQFFSINCLHQLFPISSVLFYLHSISFYITEISGSSQMLYLQNIPAVRWILCIFSASLIALLLIFETDALFATHAFKTFAMHSSTGEITQFGSRVWALSDCICVFCIFIHNFWLLKMEARSGLAVFVYLCYCICISLFL